MKIYISVIFYLFILISNQAFNKKISKDEFLKRHLSIVKILIEHEKIQSYPSKLIKEGELYTSFNISQFIFSNAYASSRNMCFFGGWPSYKKNLKCQTPWTHRKESSLKKYGARYDRNHFCGGDHLFRCNPTLFGNAPTGKGKCIVIKNYKNVTKQCYEETKQTQDEIYKQFISDKKFKENYLETAKSIASFCQNNSAYSACDYLLKSINNFQEKLCAEVIEPTLSDKVVNFLTGIIDKVSPIQSVEEEIDEVPRPVVSNLAPEKSKFPHKKPRRLQINKSCNKFYNKFLASGVPKKALKQALTFYKRNKNIFSGHWISVADYTDNSKNKRFYMFNIKTGEVRKHKVSHGSGNRNGRKNGDPNHDGNLDRCSYNGSRTNMTRPGFFKIAEPYDSSKHTNSWTNIGGGFNGLRMDGLSGSLNDHARAKGVVMHGANYNRGKTMGRSYGCPAFMPNQASGILNTIKNGSLFYSYVGENCHDDQTRVDQTLPNWERTCEAN